MAFDMDLKGLKMLPLTEPEPTINMRWIIEHAYVVS